MQTLNAGMKMRQAFVSIALIVFGGIIGFFLGGTMAGNMITGDSVSDVAMVAVSSIVTGILGAGLGLALSIRRNA